MDPVDPYVDMFKTWGVICDTYSNGVEVYFDEAHEKTAEILAIKDELKKTPGVVGPHGWWVDFTEEEILAEPWAEMRMTHESYYPQPQKHMEWKKQVYENVCPAKWCGVGFHQKAPFRFAREFRMGRYHFITPYVVNEVFAVNRVFEVLQAEGIRGWETLEARIPNGQVSQAVKQFQFPHLAKAGLLQLERYPVFTCEQCGVSKYRFHERDYFYFPEHAFSSESDFWVMQEWFGQGRFNADRRLVVSRRVVEIALREKWKGVAFRGVKVLPVRSAP
jgi:hypothetical protein